ncbi:MFS transporter [Mycobacterium neglectum]|uniref:MFS transporter n=1 Tax=Mycobacterium neglectum TaxID=242737 RepID=UPI000BFEF4B9|nr:MFS transporter [Mycobacterium neglectum]
MVTGALPTTFAVAVTALSNLPIWVFTGLAPSIGADLGFGALRLGATAAIFFAAAGLFAVPAGHAVEHIGWRRTNIVVAILLIVSFAGMSLAPNLETLAGFLVVGAVAFAFTQPSAGLTLAQTVALHRRGTAFGLKQAALPLTTLLVGITTPLFLGVNGWRWAFASCAVIGLVFLAAVVVERRRSPFVDAPLALFRRGPEPTSPRLRAQPPLMMLAVGAGLGCVATASIGGFLVVYAVSAGLTQTQAGQLLATGSIVCLASRLITGWIADRRGRRHLRVVAIMMMAGSLGFVLLAVAHSRPWLLVLGASLAFGLGWAWNGLFAFAVVHNHPEFPAAATGVVQSVMGMGSATGPALFGVTVSIASYTGAWVGAAAALALGAVFMLQGRRLLARSVAR